MSPKTLLPRPASLSDGVLRLEPLSTRFVPDFEALNLDSDVLRFTRVPSQPGDGFVAGWLSRYEQGWEDGARAGFAIVGEGDGVFLGMAALVRIDWDALEAELGYMVTPPARGRGVAGRAITLISRWAFDELGLARIEAWIDVANAPSQRVAERTGYTLEGVRRSTHFKEGKRVDMAVYSLLPADLRETPHPHP
jgi:RimJ/RimL family protein N-acetyltransferase